MEVKSFYTHRHNIVIYVYYVYDLNQLLYLFSCLLFLFIFIITIVYLLFLFYWVMYNFQHLCVIPYHNHAQEFYLYVVQKLLIVIFKTR